MQSYENYNSNLCKNKKIYKEKKWTSSGVAHYVILPFGLMQSCEYLKLQQMLVKVTLETSSVYWSVCSK